MGRGEGGRGSSPAKGLARFKSLACQWTLSLLRMLDMCVYLCVYTCVSLSAFLKLLPCALPLLFRIEEITKTRRSLASLSVWWIKPSHWHSCESLGNLHFKVYKIPPRPQQGGENGQLPNFTLPQSLLSLDPSARTGVLHSFRAGTGRLAGLCKRTSRPSKAVRVSRGDELHVNESETSGSNFISNKQGYENWWVKNIFWPISQKNIVWLFLNPTVCTCG